MTISLSKINSSLGTIASRLPVIDLQNAATQVINQNAAGTFSKLGQDINQIVSGIQGLTQEIDDPTEAEIFEGIGLVTLTGSVTGLTRDLVGDISSNQADIDAITGGSNSGGLKYQYFGGSSVNAISALLQEATGKSVNQLLPILQTLQTGNLAGFIQAAVSTELRTALAPVIAKFNVAAASSIGSAINSVLENVVDAVDGTIGNTLNALADGKLKVDKINQLLQAISNKDYAFVIREISRVSSLPISEIENTVLAQSTSIPDRIRLVDPYANLPDFVIGTTSRSWDGANTPIAGQPRTSSVAPGSTSSVAPGNIGRQSGNEPYTFSRVTSSEELEAEFRSITRDITEVVVHWTANYIDNDVGAREMHRVALERGFAGCSYHYVVRRDGTIERGRPVNLVGAHAANGGHNNYSIGFSFVAGYNCLSGTPNPNRYISSDSISSDQWAALDKFLMSFWKVFPGGQVFGHNETDPRNKSDPGIIMSDYINSKFGKTNVTAGTSSPLSPTQLASARLSSTRQIA